MRRASAASVAVASGVALSAAWLHGDGTHGTTTSQAHVLSPAAVVGQPTRSPSPTVSPKRTHAAKSPGARPSRSQSSSAAAPTRSASKPPTQVTVDGAVVDTQYGQVQVRILVTGGQLADVTALHLTDSSGRSAAISAQAAPILRQEALTARSAKIDLVSGATFTSEAYIRSLQSALDAAASQR